MNQLVDQIENEVKKAVIGKDDVIKKVLMAILAQGHVLMEDVPGVGKTTMAMSFARALGLETKRVQFTSDTMPSDIIGFSVFNSESGELQYNPGAVMTNLLLADEINRTSSKTQSALLEAMEEKNVSVDGNTYPLPNPFIVLATQNPVGSAGTQRLPSSQLDRFMLKVSMGYPDRESQVEIMKDRHHSNPLDSIEAVLDRQQLLQLINEVSLVHIADSVYQYAAELVEATRNHEAVLLGISPRGALALCRAAKAEAFIKGRGYVIPEDIADIFKDVCEHRLILGSKAKLHELTESDVLESILEEIKQPVIKEFSVK